MTPEEKAAWEAYQNSPGPFITMPETERRAFLAGYRARAALETTSHTQSDAYFDAYFERAKQAALDKWFSGPNSKT